MIGYPGPWPACIRSYYYCTRSVLETKSDSDLQDCMALLSRHGGLKLESFLNSSKMNMLQNGCSTTLEEKPLWNYLPLHLQTQPALGQAGYVSAAFWEWFPASITSLAVSWIFKRAFWAKNLTAWAGQGNVFRLWLAVASQILYSHQQFCLCI